MPLSIDDLLRRAVENKASDLHLKVGNHPYLRIDGVLIRRPTCRRVTPEEMLSMAFSMMTNRQKQKFKETAELDMAYGVAGLGRFRVNVFQQRGNVGMVLRVIPTKIRTVDELNLPRVIEQDLRGAARPGAGDGNHRIGQIHHAGGHGRPHQHHALRPRHHHRRPHRISAPRQAQLHQPARSGSGHGELFAPRLRAALRQDPDVILVGEMRDLETIATALLAAETGHLVFSTLHTLDATETIQRIIAVFPPPEQKQIRLQLAATLQGRDQPAPGAPRRRQGPRARRGSDDRHRVHSRLHHQSRQDAPDP